MVAGIRTPQEITEVARKEAGSDKPSMEKAMPEAFKRADAHLRRARKALPRHAGPRVHRRAGQALDAADARTASAPPRRRCASRSSLRTRGLITKEEAVARIDPASLDQLAAPDHRSERRAQGDRDRPAGVARRGLRRDRVLVRRGGEAQGRRQEGHPGAGRDLPGGHPRHARRRRHPHHARRHDLARRGGRARHGQALRLGRRHAPRRLHRADHARAGQTRSSAATSSPSTARPARCWPAACRWSSRRCPANSAR